MISIIAAKSSNRVIGRGGSIPWSIPADLRRFQQLTLGHTLIMGRKTFESIGRPLPGRKIIVVTGQTGYPAAGIVVAGSLYGALQLAEDDGEIFICGGGEIYVQALPLADRIYLTIVDLAVDGDTFFPSLALHEFTEISRERLVEVPPADFIILERTAASGSRCAE